MDAIANERVSQFLRTYVDIQEPAPDSEAQSGASMVQSLAALRLVSDDLARVQAMLGEIGSQRGFIQWLDERIRAAEQRGEDPHMLRWDRAYAGAKIRELQEQLPALLGTSLESRLVRSRETFRLEVLESGTLGQRPMWAGDDPGIQDALDGLLIPDSDQAVVNHYLHHLGRLQQDSTWLAQALSPGGTLARSPLRAQHLATLAHWRQQARDAVETVMGILSGTVDATQVDAVPWTPKTLDPATARPPVTAAERRAFQLEEDTAWLGRLREEARGIEDALAAQDAPRHHLGGPSVPDGSVRLEDPQQRQALAYRARRVHACMVAIRARLDILRSSTRYGEGGLHPVDLDVAHTQRLLAAINEASPALSAQPPRPSPQDEAVYDEVLPPLRQALSALQQSRESLAGMIDRLAHALQVPRGFQLSASQRGEYALLRSQRTALMAQQQRVRGELDALKALLAPTEQAHRLGRPFDPGAYFALHTRWEAARAARLEGEAQHQGALTTAPPESVAWRKSVRSSESRAPTVTRNYALSPQEDAMVREQAAADRQACMALRQSLQRREAQIREAEKRLETLERKGAHAADKADLPTAQARLHALQAARGALAGRLSLLVQRLAERDALLTSTDPARMAQRQEAIDRFTQALPAAELGQLREERLLAEAEWASAQRELARLQATAGTSNASLGEAGKLLAYRTAARAYAAARVVEKEARIGNLGQATSLGAALHSLSATRQAMQEAYFRLAQTRLVYLTDSLGARLRAEQLRGAPVEALQRLQRELEAAQVAWPRNVAPFPLTPEAIAAAVQARHGDELPE